MKKIATLIAVVCIVAITAWIYFHGGRKDMLREAAAPPADSGLSEKALSPGEKTNSSPQSQLMPGSFGNAQFLNREVSITSPNLAKDWVQLQDAAKKDPAFAYALVLKLFECMRVANDFGGFEKLNSKTLAANQGANGLSDDTRAKASVCADLTQAQFSKYVDMIDFAAASGVIKAQADYSALVSSSILTDESIKNPWKIEEYKAKSMRYYNSAARSGYAPALQNLSFAYADGIITPKNDYSAYKYLLAFDLASPRQSASRDKLLSQFQSRLTPQQISAAQREAADIYGSCCRK